MLLLGVGRARRGVGIGGSVAMGFGWRRRRQRRVKAGGRVLASDIRGCGIARLGSRLFVSGVPRILRWLAFTSSPGASGGYLYRTRSSS